MKMPFLRMFLDMYNALTITYHGHVSGSGLGNARKHADYTSFYSSDKYKDIHIYLCFTCVNSLHFRLHKIMHKCTTAKLFSHACHTFARLAQGQQLPRCRAASAAALPPLPQPPQLPLQRQHTCGAQCRSGVMLSLTA